MTGLFQIHDLEFVYLFLEPFSLDFAIFVSSGAICSLPLLINKISHFTCLVRRHTWQDKAAKLLVITFVMKVDL